MQKIIKLLTLVCLLFASSTYAEKTISLEDTSAILGEWKLYAETPALHKEKKWCKISGTFGIMAS